MPALTHRPIVLLAAAISVGAHLWLVFSGLVPTLISRPLHMALALPFVFLFAEARSATRRICGWIALAAGWIGCFYILLDRPALSDQYGALQGWGQYALAVALILVALEMARRAIQPVLPAIALLTLLYGLLGEHIPGSFGHPGIPLDYFLGALVIAEGGLWGQLTGISVDLIVPFVILGAFVSSGEAGNGFMSLSTQLAGRFRAGAAKVAVLASALYGTISGSASANVASTGAVTIPAMKRLGYPSSMAAAVEAVASTGGQIMPPVMGAGIFLMAELLRTTYAELMVVAVLPAILFFLTSWFGVHHFAVRYDLRGLDPSALPGWARVARTMPFFLLPFGVLVGMLMGGDYGAAYSAVFATAATVLLLPVDSQSGPSLALFWRRVQEALLEAARQIALIASIVICAGLIVGTFAMTGLGVKITSLIVGVSGGRLWVAMLLTAAACIVLGMELPTTAAYLICIAVAGPALVKLGLEPLHAHMFVFWYALLCTITPPVCGNVYIAASIAETPWLPVAWQSLRIGLGLFMVPLGFVANPSMLLFTAAPALALLAAAKVGIGVWLLSYAAIRADGAWPLRAAAAVTALPIIFAWGI